MKFSRTLGALLIVIIAVTIGVVVFQQLAMKPANSVSPSTAVLEPAAPGYIGNSSIYLISAKPYYGTYRGTAVFMINVTVRSDYTLQQPPPNIIQPQFNGSRVFFILYADLYDKNGARINSNLYYPAGEPFGYWMVELNDGQTTSLAIYMATSSRDVDRYSLIFRYLEGIPAA
ncbi:MAG: hypothetical protein ABSG33_03105 [Candidatus Bathyarchaeia archaeon]